MELRLVFRKMAACFRLGSKRAAALRPFLALFLAVALAVVLQNLVFAAHTETTVISPPNTTFVKNNTLRAFDFNVSWTGGADNITAINISLPSGFLLGSFGNLSGAGFACTNVSASLVNCSNSSAYGLNPAAPSVIIQVNATPQVATGAYNWVINTTDTAAEINGSIVTTSVDSEAPTVAAPSVNVSSPTRLNTNFFINTSFNDTSPAGVNGSGVVACSYNVTNSTGGLVVSAPMNYSTGVVGVANATIQSILPEGNNSVFVNCTDNVTFTGYSSAAILTVDTTPPTASIQSPANTTYASAAIPLNFTAGDLNGISSCKYELANSSGLPVNYSLSNCGNVSSMSGVTEGSNSVRVWANDSAGNWNVSATVSFSVDTAYPSVNINSPPNQSWQRGAVSVNYSATDTKTIDACSWRWKNSTGVWSGYTSLTCGSSLAFSFNTANCEDNSTAACVVEVRANDTANNVNSTEAYLRVDNTAPVVNVSQPAGGWFNSSVLVRITVNDSTSNVSSVVFYNGSAWASAVLESGDVYNGIWNGTIHTNAFSDGTSIQISANATDSVGNNGSDASVPTIQADNNPPTLLTPTLNVSSPSRFNTNIFVNSTFNDNGGQGMAADTCQLYVTNATTVSAYAINNSAGAGGPINNTLTYTLTDGTNNIYLNCTDQQGWTGSNYTSLLVDTVPPAIAIQSPVATNYSTAAIPLNFTAGDLNGISSCRYELANSSGSFNVSLTNCQNATLSGVTEGSNSVKVWANDTAGNWNVSASVSFVSDTTYPSPIITDPPALSWTQDTTPTINFTITDNLDSVLNYTVFVEGANVSSGTVANGTPQTYTLPIQEQGSHAVTVEALDEAGNRVNSSVTIVVDNTKPSVANPAGNVSAVRTGTPVKVSATITDTYSFNASRLFAYNSTGGSFAMVGQGGDVYAAFITVTEIGDNPSLRYNISAYDNASNLNASMYVTFNLDNTTPAVYAPTINVSSPTRFNTNLFINTSFNDTALSGVNGSGVVACTYNVTNSTGAVISWTLTNSSGGVVGVANATISIPLPDGPNSIFVNCSDAVGWVGYSSASTLIVDTVAPSWNQTPSSQTVEYGTAFYYQINASDLYLNKYSISDTANFTINPATGAIQNSTLLPIGAHPLAAYVNDTAGNLNSSSFTVNVSDTIYPVVSSITTTPSIGTAGTTIIINATIADVPPLVVKAKIQYVNMTNHAVVDYALLNMSASGSNYNATWATSGAYNGTYVVDINVTDGGGNNVIVNDGASIALGFDAQSAYSNSSVSTDSSNQTTVSAANITIQIQANNSRQNESVTIVKYSSDPSGSSLANSFGATGIGAFTDIVSSISGSNLTWALIKIYYTDAQLSGMLESQLGVYYWNGTHWQKLTTRMGWVYGTGVNTTGNYVWANVSHLSLYAAAGDEQGPQTSIILQPATPTYANVTFTALIDDVSLGGSDIAAAEYYLGSDPGLGAGTALYPQDGLGFDGNRSETVNGTINVDALSNGAHTLYVRGMDAASNWGTAAYYTFMVNKTAPALNSINISNNATYSTSASVTLSLSASNASECAFSNDNSAYGAWEVYSTIKPWLLSSGDGAKTVYYKCRNSAGLEASAISDSIILDTTAPTINITAPAAGTTANGNYSINFSISDANGVSPQNVSISIDGADWISTGSNFSYGWNTSLYSDGYHTIIVRAFDSAGNAGESLARGVYVNNADQRAPALSSIANGTVTDSYAIISWSTDENASSQVEYGLSVSYGSATGELDLSPRVLSHSVNLTAGLSPGTLYHYRVLSKDASGNLNISSDYNFTTSSVDVTVPSVNITYPAAGSAVNGVVSVNYTISDAGGVNASNVSILFDGGAWIVTNSNSTYSWNTSLFADYSHTIKIRAVDSSGNAGYSEIRSVYVNNADQIAPVISSVANGSVTDSLAVITWSTDENSSSQVEYGRSVSYGFVTGELDLSPRVLSHSVNLTAGLSPGTLYHYRVLSRDASGNLNVSSEYNFTTSSVDTTAPVINITAPAAGSTVNGVVSVNYTISDGGGVNGSNVSIQFDGGGGWIQANSNFSYSWNTSLFLDGAHFLQVKAVDSSGNAGLSDLRLVYVNNADRDAPGIFAVLSVATSSSATISWNTTENADSLVEYGLSSGSYSWVTGTYADNSTTHSVLVSGLSSGTQYFYRLKSRDNSGNLNTSQEFSFTTQSVDSSLPSVAIVSPRGGEYVGLSKAVSINVSDGSGIDPATILLYKDGALLHQYSLPECTGAGTTASPYLCSWLWNTTEDDDGVPHTLLLSAYDLASNRQTHSITVFVDRVKPLIQSNTAPSNSQYLYVSEPMVNFTVSRGSQGLVNKSSISVAVDGQASLDFTPASNCSLSEGTSDYFCSFRITRYSYTQLGYAFNSSLMLGNHSLLISASDLAGNNAAPRSVNFTLLDVNDTVSINSIVMDKATAVANGIDYWQYTFSVSLGPSAGNRISLKLADWQDGYGHSIPASYANLTVGSNKAAIGNSYLYTLPVSDDNPSTAGVQASLIVKQYIPSGTEPVSYYTTYGIKTFDLDNPALSSTLPANNSFLNYAISNVTAIFSDSGGSGIDLAGSGISLSNTSGLVSGTRVSLQPDSLALNLSSLPDGNYTIGAVPRDKYGNAGSTYYAYFVLDRIPPTAAALNPLPTYTTNLRVYLNWSGASDDRSGVSYYQIWRSSGSGFANIANTTGTSYNDTAVSDGVLYYYNISTVDRAGNVQFYSALSSTTIDITQPSAPILSPLTTPTGTPAVTVSGTAEPYSTVTVYLNGAFADAKVASSGGAFTTDSFTLSEGNNILNATATDLAGLASTGSTPISVLLDTTPPVIGSLSPANSSNVSSAAPEVSAVFNESGSGINASTILLIVDSAAASYSYDPAAKKVSNVSALSEGVHNISLFVRDLVGNPSLLLQWSFRVDLTPPPQISGSSVVQDTNTTLNLSWSASPAPDLAYYKIYRRELVSFSNVSLAALVNGSLTSTSYRDSGLAPSWTYYYAVTAVDNVGNENSTVVSKYNATLS